MFHCIFLSKQSSKFKSPRKFHIRVLFFFTCMRCSVSLYNGLHHLFLFSFVVFYCRWREHGSCAHNSQLVTVGRLCMLASTVACCCMWIQWLLDHQIYCALSHIFLPTSGCCRFLTFWNVLWKIDVYETFFYTSSFKFSVVSLIAYIIFLLSPFVCWLSFNPPVVSPKCSKLNWRSESTYRY
jgi:hypothetical protein